MLPDSTLPEISEVQVQLNGNDVQKKEKKVNVFSLGRFRMPVFWKRNFKNQMTNI
jgi:hypothetical protein